MKIHTKTVGNTLWEYYYDRSYRVWWAYQVDSDGERVSDESLNAYSKQDILDLIGEGK